MKYFKTYEFYKISQISVDDVIDCIKKDGLIYVDIIKNLPNHNKEEGLPPLDVDNDGLVTINFDGKEYEVELKNIKRVEYDDDKVTESIKMHTQFLDIITYLKKKKENNVANILYSLWNSDYENKEIDYLNFTKDLMISYLPHNKMEDAFSDEEKIYVNKKRISTRIGRCVKKLIDDSKKNFFSIKAERELAFRLVKTPPENITIINLGDSMSIHAVDGIKNILLINGKYNMEILSKNRKNFNISEKYELPEIDRIKKVGKAHAYNYYLTNVNKDMVKDLDIPTGEESINIYDYKKIKCSIEIKSDINITDSDIEKFVNEFTSMVKSNTSESAKIEVVTGDDIKDCYNRNNYSSSIGKLGNSCMANPKVSNFLDIYCKNPNRVSLLVIRNSENKITGRALLWKIDEKPGMKSKYFMDRVYTIYDSEENIFINHAIKNGWYYRSNGDNTILKYYFNGKSDQGVKLFVTLDKFKFEYYPYLDTLFYLCLNLLHTKGYLTNDQIDKEGSIIAPKVMELTSVNGDWN